MTMIPYAGHESERSERPRPNWDAAVARRAELRKADRTARAIREEARIAAKVSAALRHAMGASELRAQCLAGAPKFINPEINEKIASSLMRRGRTWAEVRGDSICAQICLARFEIAHILVGYGFSLAKTGLWLGGRTHTAILHAVRRHQERIDAGEVTAP